MLLCPFCHCTQHLEDASRLKAARLIWLPATSQADLIAFQATLFMLLMAPKTHTEAIRPIRDDMYRLNEEIYRTGESALESHFVGTDVKEATEARRGKETAPPKKVWTPLPATDPYVLSVALKTAGEVIPDKIEGLRLFFLPQPFREHLKAWAPEFFAAHPVEYWGGQANSVTDEEHFRVDEPSSQ